MTVSSTTVKNSYSGNGSTTQFAYAFKIFADSDLEVIIRSATGTETVKTLTTHYTVAGAGDASGGSITFTSGNTPTNTQTVVIRREVPQTQAIDYIANDPFPAESHEEGLDRATMTIQQLQEEVNRSIKLSATNTMNSTEFTVGATDRANKILAFDSSGELSVTQELGTFKGDSATTTTEAYAIRDIVKGTTTAQLNNIYICIQASPVGTALTNTSYWVLIVDAVTSATSAATATTKAAAALSSANAAAASETAAETAEANAETAEAAAETAQAAAEAAFDSFDDRYLGAKSSAPSTDNDGNALLTGALYFNSSSSQIFNWTAADAWEAIKPTSSEQTAINALGASAVVADMAILATTDIVADMAILGTNDVVADMAILATSDVVTDMNVLGTADVVNDMNVLGSSATVTAMNLLGTSAVVTDMGILATTDIVADMAILATTDIVADMALLGTSANVSAMDLIGTSTVIANIATVAANVAGVNSFASRYRVGSSNPTSDLDEGDLFYNTTSNVVLFYNGSAWITIVAGNVTQTGSETLTNKTLTDAVAITNSVTGQIIPGKTEGTNFTDSLLVGHATTGTLNAAEKNTGVGIEALDAITSGDRNVALGYQAGSALTTGSFNTGIGTSALIGLTGANSNTAIGYNTLRDPTGSDNTGIGSNALKAVNTGVKNIGIGSSAGKNITSGDGNVIIGAVEATSATGDRQLLIAGNDGSTTTNWISGTSAGAITFNGAYTFPTADGSASQVLQTNGSGALSFATSSAVANTPAFSVRLNSSQEIANNTFVKIAFDGELFDTDSAFASNKFTVPSGKGGNYFFNYGIQYLAYAANRGISSFRKNGTEIQTSEISPLTASTNPTITGALSLNLAAGDYVEVFVYQNSGSAQDIRGSSSELFTYFGGYKIIT